MTGAGSLGPVLAVARRGARARWWSHLVVGVLVAITVAMAVATLTGARRSETALDRLRDETSSSDLQLFPADDDVESAIDELLQVEGVVQAGVTSELFVRPVGSELFPDYQLLAVAARTDLAGEAVDVPHIVEGRALRRDAVDEIVMSVEFADELGVDAGDRIEIESMTDAWIDVAFNGGDPGPPDGPVVAVEVVGLSRSPADFGRFAGRIIHLSPAFAARYEDRIRTYTWVAARAADPSEAGLIAMAEGPLAGYEAEEVGFSFFSDSPATQDGLSTIAVALRLVALVGVLAGTTAIGLALARLARDTLDVRTTLSAIGWTRAQLVALVSVQLGPWVLGGVGMGVLLGTLGSPVATVGLARSVDPDLGALAPYTGWIVVVGLGSVVLLCALLVLAAWRAAGATERSAAGGAPLPRLVQPLALSIGARRALFGAAERGGRASRGAALAVVASVTVAVAGLVVSGSIQRLEDDPALSGQGSLDQRQIDSGESLEVFEQAMAALADDERVVDLLGVHVAFGIRGPGTGELTALVYDVRRGELDVSTVRGRLAVQPDEVAVGPKTLEELGLDVGDEVELSSEQGAATFRIVGTTLFPEGDFEHDSGVAMTVGGADRILGGVEAGAIHLVVFGWADGIDIDAADQTLVDRGLRPLTSDEGLQPPAVSNLGEVRDLPLVLAALVLVLGLATLVHALVVTTRLRDDEAGTLRALGVLPRSVAAIVETQASVVALLAVLAGIPLGLALGRQVWSPIAERAHVVEVAVAPWAGAAWVALVVLAGTAVLAVPIAVRALHRRPTDALRVE